jgi:hypothetical protein
LTASFVQRRYNLSQKVIFLKIAFSRMFCRLTGNYEGTELIMSKQNQGLVNCTPKSLEYLFPRCLFHNNRCSI